MNIDSLGNAQQNHPAIVAPYPRDKVAQNQADPANFKAVNPPPFVDHQLEWLAQQGDQAALSKILNQVLHLHRSQVVEIEIKAPGIKLSIESQTVPDQQQILPLIKQRLNQLQPEGISSVTVYGQQVGRELPFWMEEMALQPMDSTAAPTAAAPDSCLPPPQRWIHRPPPLWPK
ncbi:MAG: hypothetical protein HC792_01510 [Acaryochloridaceae cyanobacterium CSU_5_19]|nr:hypothetical protein [Acaryochloridaceae cyanobacterium CSU_5_19]